MKNKLIYIITTIVCLLPIIYGLIVYGKLPDMIPTHWGANNEVNGYTSKNFTVFGLPVIMAALNLLSQFALKTDPRRSNYPSIIKNIFAWLVPLLSVIVIPISLLAGQGKEVNIGFITTIILSVMFIVLGNYMPKCKQNYTVGIKLPWTLNSERNWNKTHRLAGYVYMISGITMLIVTFLGQTKTIFTMITILIMPIILFVPAIYSFALYKKGI